MTRLPVLAVALAAAATGGPAHGAEAPAAGADEPARCAVWARELGFARSVAEHDMAAFAEHVHADAVFGVGGRTTRGRAAIVADWRGIVDGSALELRWYPDQVSVAGDGDHVMAPSDPVFQAAVVSFLRARWPERG